MKFCYFDESGMGDEPYLVMAGIIVDATQMHVTKDVWADFLERLSEAFGKRVDEFHSREFYRGNGIWRGRWNQKGENHRSDSILGRKEKAQVCV